MYTPYNELYKGDARNAEGNTPTAVATNVLGDTHVATETRKEKEKDRTAAAAILAAGVAKVALHAATVAAPVQPTGLEKDSSNATTPETRAAAAVLKAGAEKVALHAATVAAAVQTRGLEQVALDAVSAKATFLAAVQRTELEKVTLNATTTAETAASATSAFRAAKDEEVALNATAMTRALSVEAELIRLACASAVPAARKLFEDNHNAISQAEKIKTYRECETATVDKNHLKKSLSVESHQLGSRRIRLLRILASLHRLLKLHQHQTLRRTQEQNST